MTTYRLPNYSILRGIFLSIICLSAVASFGQKYVHRSDVSGTDFYIVFPRSSYGSQDVGVLINSPVKQKITYYPPRDSAHHIFINAADTTIYFSGPFNVEYLPEKVRSNRVVHISSEYPITIHGQFGITAISGTYTALPTSSWGQEYYVVDLPEGDNTGYPPIYSVPTITVIAAHNSTAVTFWPKSITATGKPVDQPLVVSMDSGDVYTLSTPGDPNATPPYPDVCPPNDFSGTYIYATKPVGVIIAQSHTSIPCQYNQCGDYAVEWLPPFCNWDTMYVIPPTIPRIGATLAYNEVIRVVFGADTTRLWQTDYLGNDHALGRFSAEGYADVEALVTGKPPYILHGDHPFLPLEITNSPGGCIDQQGGDGGEPWTLSFNIPSGVNQWSNRVSFSTAYTSTGSIANIYFRQKDLKNLYINGVSFAAAYPSYTKLGKGYALAIDNTIQPVKYYEIRGDSGATVSGMLFGHGSGSSSPGGNPGETPQGPNVVKSFAHPIGFNAIQQCSADSIPPYDSVGYSCGHWTITMLDDEAFPRPTGLYSIILVRDRGNDSSYNVQFAPAPHFDYGDYTTTFGIDVVNLAQNAQAVLRVRDGAGNEFDTTLIFHPQILDAVPALVDAGIIKVGDSVTKTMVMHNRSTAAAVDVSRFRLKFGTHWKIVQPATSDPFSVAPNDSIIFKFQYNSPNTTQLECDPDTLLLTTCKEFPFVGLHGCNKRPAVFAQGFDFGELAIDTIGQQGENAVSLGRQIFVANVGSDVLHITGITFGGLTMAVPDSDFSPVISFPSVAKPLVLQPGDTNNITVQAHPHHSGLRKAYLAFQSDASQAVNDTAFLSVTGRSPTGVRENVAPVTAGLLENYPNPFANSSVITFSAPSSHSYTVRIYDNLGAQVATLPADANGSDKFSATWSAVNATTGVYHYYIFDAATNRRVQGPSGKIVVLK